MMTISSSSAVPTLRSSFMRRFLVTTLLVSALLLGVAVSVDADKSSHYGRVFNRNHDIYQKDDNPGPPRTFNKNKRSSSARNSGGPHRHHHHHHHPKTTVPGGVSSHVGLVKQAYTIIKPRDLENPRLNCVPVLNSYFGSHILTSLSVSEALLEALNVLNLLARSSKGRHLKDFDGLMLGYNHVKMLLSDSFWKALVINSADTFVRGLKGSSDAFEMRLLSAYYLIRMSKELGPVPKRSRAQHAFAQKCVQSKYTPNIIQKLTPTTSTTLSVSPVSDHEKQQTPGRGGGGRWQKGARSISSSSSRPAGRAGASWPSLRGSSRSNQPSSSGASLVKNDDDGIIQGYLVKAQDKFVQAISELQIGVEDRAALRGHDLWITSSNSNSELPFFEMTKALLQANLAPTNALYNRMLSNLHAVGKLPLDLAGDALLGRSHQKKKKSGASGSRGQRKQKRQRVKPAPEDESED